MGGACSSEKKIQPGGPNDVMFTAIEKQAIFQSWALLGGSDAYRTNAPNFFLLLFKMHPYMMEFFPQFRGKSLSELPNSSTLRAHSVAVFAGLATCIGCLDDEVAFTIVVQKMAGRHFIRNVTFNELENVKTVYLFWMKQLLGGKLHPESHNAWGKFFKIHNNIYKDTCEELAEAGFGGNSSKKNHRADDE